MVGDFHGTRVTSVDSDIEDCIDAGIILVGSAGNSNGAIVVKGDPDYENRGYNDGDSQTLGYSFLYNRGSTPSATSRVICVGAISADVSGGEEVKLAESAKGTRIDVFAPGGLIMAATSTNGDGSEFAAEYPLNSQFKATKLSGTSTASPQIVGILATHMEGNPSLTQDQAMEWVVSNAVPDRLTDSTTGDPSVDFPDTESLMDAPNRYAQTPYVSGHVIKLEGGAKPEPYTL